MSAHIPEIIKKNRSLAELTTFEIGGAASFFAEPAEPEQLTEIITWANREKLLLAADTGYNGLILKPGNKSIDILEETDKQVLIRAGAGVVWDDLAAYAVRSGWSGIECLSGIPGRVGASPVQNIGAYGQEAAHTIEAVEVLDLTDTKSGIFGSRECNFAYRSSNFKTVWKGKYLITAVRFRLSVHGQATLRYKDLQAYFNPGSVPTLSEVRQAVLAIRRAKSTFYDIQDPNHRCAGSFFTNPIVPKEQADDLLRQYPEMPVYPASGNDCKLSAAWLIDHAGFNKGFRYGNAKLSDKHVLCLVNAGGAGAQEILHLAGMVQNGVEKQFGVRLTAEPNLLGF